MTVRTPSSAGELAAGGKRQLQEAPVYPLPDGKEIQGWHPEVSADPGD